MMNYIKIVKDSEVELVDKAVSIHHEITGVVEIKTEKGRTICLGKNIVGRIRLGL